MLVRLDLVPGVADDREVRARPHGRPGPTAGRQPAVPRQGADASARPPRPPARRSRSFLRDVQELGQPRREPVEQGRVARRPGRSVGDAAADPDPLLRLVEEPVGDAEDPGDARDRARRRLRRSIGTSTASSGRSSSLTENLANGNSSFQRSSLRYDFRNMSLIGGAYCAQQMIASAGSRMTVTRRSNRRRPSRTRSQLAIPSRSARSSGARPSSANHRSTSAGRTAEGAGRRAPSGRRGAAESADDIARGVYRSASTPGSAHQPGRQRLAAARPCLACLPPRGRWLRSMTGTTAGLDDGALAFAGPCARPTRRCGSRGRRSPRCGRPRRP